MLTSEEFAGICGMCRGPHAACLEQYRGRRSLAWRESHTELFRPSYADFERPVESTVVAAGG